MVFADDTSTFNVQGSKKASPTTLGQDRKTTVTLSLPSGEYQNKVDIVFVMDNSTSVANDHYDFGDNSEKLLNAIIDKNPGVDLKVGVVKFRGFATDMLGNGLTPYEGNESAIKAAIENNNVPGNGSNAHGGLIMADKMLEADNEVDNSNKYVVFLTDCKSYIWNNENNKPVTYYMQYAEKNTVKNGGKPTLNQKAGIYNKEQGPSYHVPQIDREIVDFTGNVTQGLGDTSKYYQRLFESKNSELSSTNTKYDEPAYYSKYYDPSSFSGSQTVGDGTVVKRTLTNGASIFKNSGQVSYRDYYDYTPDASTFWKDIDYLQLNPYNVIYNEEDKTYSYDENSINEDFFLWHPDGFQKGLYLAGHYWKDEIVAKYNAASISYDPKSGGGTNLASSLHHWLFENSDFSADIKDSDTVSAMFEDIDNSIRYMVGSGVVTDQIKDDFDLDESSATPFRMTYDGEPLEAASAGDNKWNFDTDDKDNIISYVVEYDKSTKTITWTINVPIENLKKITLSYDLILKEDRAPGTYDTNEFAKLAYTSSDGKYEGEYPFEKPQVTYSKPAPTPADYTLTINYVYANGRTAATSYRSTLKAGASYGPINSPAISGYRADRASVSGVMPEGNVTIRVVYSAIPDDDDDDDDDNPVRRNPGGAGPVVTPGDGQAPPPTIPDEPTPTTEPPATVIVDPEPPLAAGAWALINLICAILTALGAIIALFRRKEEEDEDEDEDQNAYKAEDEEEEDDNRGKKMLAAKAAGVLAGVAAPITFFLTEDMSLPMQLTDKWTLLMAVILAVQIVAAVFNKKASELDDDEEETAEEAAN